MKKLIFVLLKIAEISLVPVACFVLYYLGILYCYVIGYFVNGDFDISYQLEKGNFMIGLVGLLISIMLFAVFMFVIKVIPFLFVGWIDKNKEWSENLSEWLKSRFS